MSIYWTEHSHLVFPKDDFMTLTIRKTQSLLVQQTKIVRECLATCRAATERLAQALAVIHDQELYRVKYRTFEEFCIEEFDLTRSRGYQLLDFAKVVKNLRANNCGHLAIPACESHARLLAPLPVEKQIKAARQVRESVKAKGRSKPLTADYLEAVKIVRGDDNSELQNTETPPSLCQWIYERLDAARVRPRTILDPCAGRGNLTRPFQRARVIEYERKLGSDFFKARRVRCDLVLCNPPWEDPLRWFKRIVEVVGNRTPMIFICPMNFLVHYKTAPSRKYLDSPHAPRLSHVTPLPNDTFVGVYLAGAVLWFNLPQVQDVALVPNRYLIRSNHIEAKRICG
jgi:hypothetical protein